MPERCLSPDELEEQAARPDSEIEAGAAAHFGACASCRARLATLRRDASLFDELRGVARRAQGTPLIPGYRIAGELSRGGQGVVYRAVQEATHREVALKVLAHGAAGSARERRRFEREVELSSRLAHPGIVTVFDSGVAEGAPWYAMELVQGETLDAYVARARPERTARLRLFLELCAAVAHAHRAGVLHRDLKPGNVLVDGEGRVRVLDFGTALALEGGLRGRATVPGEFLGTLAYASPEQVGGAPLDTRTDVYSLGVVLYELVADALPFDVGGSLSQVVERVLTAPPRPLPPGDAELAALLARALAKDPERRYSSVEALARDVEHYLAHEPLEARPRRFGYVLGKALRRHRRACAAAALLLVAGAALAGTLVRERWRTERAREDGVLVRDVIEALLSAAAPQRMGGDARLLDALALASHEIDTTLAGAPDAQAALQLTLGDTYRRLLMPNEAETHLRAALERFRRVDGPERLEVARCLDRLGQVLTDNNSTEAVSVQEEALALRRGALAPGDPRIAESERGLALALAAQFREPDFVRARELLAAAHARFRAALGDDAPEVAETEVALARSQGDDLAAAEPLLVHALAVFDAQDRAGERGDPRAIECLTEYALLCQALGRYDQAEGLLERAAQLTAELYGDELVTEMLRRFANLRFARGDVAGAEELTRRALAHELGRWAGRRPEDAPAIARLTSELDGARAAGLEPPYAEAFALLRRFRGDGAFELAQWANGVVVTLVPQGRGAACEAILREALSIRCRAWGADCPIRQRTLQLLAEVLAEQGREREAVPLLEESVRIADAQGDEATEERALLARCCAAVKEDP